MELTNIKREPIEVVYSLRKKKSIELRNCTIPDLQKKLADAVSELQAQGLPLLRLEFSAGDDDDGDTRVYCTVIASRLETPEEMQARITRLDAYNARQIAEHKAKIEASRRNKELQRLTKHLSLEQLRALVKVEAP